MRHCLFLLLALSMTFAGCGKDAATDTEASGKGKDRASRGGRPGGSGGGPGGGRPGGPGGGEARAAVPVETASVERRAITAFLETNGTLEAENDVDLLARTSGPIVELLVEEGMQVAKGRLLARIDPQESRARVEISRVALQEAEQAWARAKALYEDELLSQEAYDQALSRYESAKAQLAGDEILFGYTEIRAPFAGTIVQRYIKLAQTVSVNTPLLRITAFDPLLCPIQVPERELQRLHLDQKARITVEGWPEEIFSAKVLRISPVVDSSTGTVKVTLKVEAQGKLRPGMFASVYLETETRPDALVIPRGALSLESIGDTVYATQENEKGELVAARREVKLGFLEGDFVEVTSGLSEGEKIVTVGQDGLSDGTPIQVLVDDGQASGGESARPERGGERRGEGGPGSGERGEGQRAEGKRGGER